MSALHIESVGHEHVEEFGNLLTTQAMVFGRIQIYCWRYGKSASKFDRSAYDQLVQDLDLDKLKGRALVLDFSRVTEFGRRLLIELRNVAEKREVPALFVNLTLPAAEALKVKRKNQDSTNLQLALPRPLSEEEICRTFGAEYSLAPNESSDSANTVEYRFILQEVLRHCRPYEIDGKEEYVTLKSTQIRANKYFDARALLGDPKVYPWLISRLADIVESITGRVGGFRLMACTPNATMIASAIHRLIASGLSKDAVHDPVLGVDFIGRSGNVLESVFASRRRSRIGEKRNRYIFVSDFIIAGTEIKLAAVHAAIRNGDMQDAISIACILPKSNFADETKWSAPRPLRVFTAVELGSGDIPKYQFP